MKKFFKIFLKSLCQIIGITLLILFAVVITIFFPGLFLAAAYSPSDFPTEGFFEYYTMAILGIGAIVEMIFLIVAIADFAEEIRKK